MSLQPSASRTTLLIACPRPFDPNAEDPIDPSSEPALYGSGFHQAIAACLRSPKSKPLEKNTAAYAKTIAKAVKTFGLQAEAHELAGHVKSSVKYLRNWLRNEKLEIVEVEKAHSIWAKADGGWESRDIEPHDDEHHYEVAPGVLPGTDDVIAKSKNGGRIVVLDHKTGEDADWYGEDTSVFSRPASMDQMKTLGLIPKRRTLSGRALDVEVGIFHADRRGLPIVYTEPYDAIDARAHVRELYAAFGRIGSGFLRAGPHCKRCPARATCPAHTANLLSEGAASLVRMANKLAMEPVDPKGLYVLPDEGDPLAAPIEQRAAVLYDLIKKFTVLRDAGMAELRSLVRSGRVIETFDGKVLALRTQTFETLSKKSVLEGMGFDAGTKMLAKLRAKGAIRESTRDMLVGEK